jgi:hypothetical protein
MTSVQERQTPFGQSIPWIGRLIFQSLSYLGSFLVGALAVPPLLAGNALSLFGLYRPDEPNPLLNGQVLPNFVANTNRNGLQGVAASNQPVNDLSEALFRLGQKNAHQIESSSNLEQSIAHASSGNSNQHPHEISEIVNDLM